MEPWHLQELLRDVDARGTSYLSVCSVNEALTGPAGMALTKLTSPSRDTPDRRKGRMEADRSEWTPAGDAAVGSSSARRGATGQASRRWWDRRQLCEGNWMAGVEDEEVERETP